MGRPVSPETKRRRRRARTGEGMRGSALTAFQLSRLRRSDAIGAHIADAVREGLATHRAIEDAAEQFHVSLRTAYGAWRWWRIVQPTPEEVADATRRTQERVARAWSDGLKPE